MHPPDQTSLLDGDILAQHVAQLQSIIDRTLHVLRGHTLGSHDLTEHDANRLLATLRMAADEIRRVTGEEAALPF